ncbi:MAG: transcription antitermination factor NusB [Planctomycetaceae bacterium]
MSGGKSKYRRPHGNRRSKWSRQSKDDNPETITVSEITSGRLLAWLVLEEYERTGRFLTDIFASLDNRHRLSSQERALAVDLASGVVRRRRTIDALLQSQISRPRQDVETDLWRLLQLGTYQLVFARTPDHAAVDTTVELAKQLQRSRWTGFANGVLRNIARLLVPRSEPPPRTVQQQAEPFRQSVPGQSPGTSDSRDHVRFAADLVPLSNGEFRRLASDVFPDPQTRLADYIGEAFSLPNSLTKRWAARFELPDLLTACFHSIDPPQVTIRINPLRSSTVDVQQMLSYAGVDVSPGEMLNALRIRHASRVDTLPGFADGLWSVQDTSAMKAGFLLNPKPGERILDLCAAPGGKSCHLAELSDNSATIIACDVNETRLARVTENVDRLGLTSVVPALIQRDGGNIPGTDFDAALVDVPCSNTGVLSRRPEARWRFREADLPELVILQTRLLLTAFDRVKPGGRIVYSTCSIEPEETTDLIRDVLAAVNGLTLIEQRVYLPGKLGDGAYQALLRKA